MQLLGLPIGGTDNGVPKFPVMDTQSAAVVIWAKPAYDVKFHPRAITEQSVM